MQTLHYGLPSFHTQGGASATRKTSVYGGTLHVEKTYQSAGVVSLSKCTEEATGEQFCDTLHYMIPCQTRSVPLLLGC